MAKMTRKTAANKIRKAAKAWRKFASGSPHENDTALTDYLELCLIASGLELGKDLDETRMSAYRLDTIVRDQIPRDVWKLYFHVEE